MFFDELNIVVVVNTDLTFGNAPAAVRRILAGLEIPRLNCDNIARIILLISEFSGWTWFEYSEKLYLMELKDNDISYDINNDSGSWVNIVTNRVYT